MKKAYPRIFSVLVVIAITISLLPALKVNADSSGTLGTGVTWTMDDNGTVTITGTGDMDDFDSESNRSPFTYNKDVKRIIIEDGVTSIGDNVFAACTNLEEITIPDSVTSIGDYALASCRNLISISIPNNVTYIGKSAFNNCKSLKEITIPNSLTSIEELAFADCKGFESVIIPDSVTSIGPDAFNGCSSLTDIEIPNSVTSIGIGAFAYCKALTSIEIPDSVTSIGFAAFNYCSSLETITIPDGVTSIEHETFEDCVNLKSITIPDSVTSIGYGAFYNCSSLETITIPDSVTSIGDSAFFNCKALTSIVIPDGVTSIQYQAFSGCANLKNITLHDSVTAIGTLAFAHCDNLKSVTIPISVKSIDSRGFMDCKNLETVVIEKTLYESVRSTAFTFCPKLDTGNIYFYYDIEFVDDDGTVLLSDRQGGNPVYTGSTPTKADTVECSYTFSGWSDGTKTYGPSDELPVLTADAKYTARYSSNVRSYEVKFVNEDGTVLQTESLKYGATPVYSGATPVKAADEKYTYAFAGWSSEITTVTGDATYTAVFNKVAGTYYLNGMVEQDGNLVFTIKMKEDDTKTFDLLGTVSSDGTVLTEGTQYSKAKGSAIITINKSYLDTLTAGTHRLTVTFTDGGSITIEYEVKNPANVPSTGEAISVTYITGVSLILAAAYVALAVNKKRKEA